MVSTLANCDLKSSNNFASLSAISGFISNTAFANEVETNILSISVFKFLPPASKMAKTPS